MYPYLAQYFEKPIERASYDGAVVSLFTRQNVAIETVAQGSIESVLDIDPRDLLRFYLRDLNFVIPNRVMLDLGREDNFELWSLNMQLIGTGNALIRRLSYPIAELMSKNWNELFHRDPFSEAKLMAAAKQLMSGTPFLTDVTDYHLVRETGGKQIEAYVKVKAVTIARDQDSGEPRAFLAITNIKDSIHAAL